MTGIGSGYVSSCREQLLSRYGLMLAFAIFLVATGCSTTGGLSRHPEADEPATGQIVESEQAFELEQAVEREKAVQKDLAARIAQLESREKELERQIRLLNSKLKAEKVARESQKSRFEVAQAAREDAIREVVRIRARIQGMASQAEASAMFAEARVILDRMEEEAYNEQSREDLALARSYMARGKGALDAGNSGGAAYLFDLIPGLYEGMKKADPRTVKISVRIAALRKTPEPSSAKLSTLYWGDSATGIEKGKNWLKIRTTSGQTGWVMMDQVQ